MIESPTAVVEEAVSEQLRGVLGQATAAVQQLPGPVMDTLASGLSIPLGKQAAHSSSHLDSTLTASDGSFMISYLDDEILAGHVLVLVLVLLHYNGYRLVSVDAHQTEAPSLLQVHNVAMSGFSSSSDTNSVTC